MSEIVEPEIFDLCPFQSIIKAPSQVTVMDLRPSLARKDILKKSLLILFWIML